MMNLLLFEWKLFFRNKRLKQQFILMLLVLALLSFQLTNLSLLKGYALFTEIYLIAMMGAFAQFAVYSFATNASFIEKQLTTPLSVFKILQTKYYFFCILSFIPFLAFLPSLFWGSVHFLDLFSTFLFVVGFVLFGLFYCTQFSYKPFDTKATAFYNYQGIDKGNYFFPLFIMILAFGIILLIFWLFDETTALILKSIIGIVFIATHRIWLKFIAQKIEEKKYYRIERFRGK